MHELTELSLDIHARDAVSKVDQSTRDCILREFSHAKQRLVYRFTQVFRFWKLLPWKLLKLGSVLLKPDCPETLQVARDYACQFLKAFDAAELEGAGAVARLGHLSKRFLAKGGELRVYVVRFSNGEPMAMPLRLETVI